MGLVRFRLGLCGALKAVESTACPAAPQLLGNEVAVRLSLKGTHPVVGLVQVTVSGLPAATAQH